MSAFSAAEAAELLIGTAESGGTAAAVTLVGGPSSAHLGARLVRICDEGGDRQVGTLGSAPLDRAALACLDEAIGDSRARDGIRAVHVSGAEPYELYLELRRPIRELVVVGAGHVAQPMAHIGALLGYRVTVLDDRPDFATRERFPDAYRLVRADFADPFADVALHARSYLLLVTRGPRRMSV